MWLVPIAAVLLGLDLVSSIFVGERRTENGLHVPLHHTQSHSLVRRGIAGLGSYYDVSYNVLLDMGKTPVPLILDTGSSDLWAVSETCTSDQCDSASKAISRYPQSSFQPTSLSVSLLYGDSMTGTHAFGLIGKDTVNLAGSEMQNQYFGSIDDTNTSVLQAGSAGIFGLGFPINSAIWMKLFEANVINSTKREIRESDASHHLNNYRRPAFPDFSHLMSRNFLQSRQSDRGVNGAAILAILNSWATYGPLINRMIAQEKLKPMVTVALQRNTVDLGGNAGLLSIGELPSTVKNESLTWVPIRRYSPVEGGLPGPPDSPGERYPVAWEIAIDDVYLDGEKLPRSTLAASTISVSALIDTGNSLLRGPADIVRLIQEKLGGSRFSCTKPHTLAFQIGGKMFPVDPRDFVSGQGENVRSCTMNLVKTDTPTVGGGYLYSWSLGDPFLKSVLSSYYFGDIRYPSRDPPRLGFLSTVPSDANEKYLEAVTAAQENGRFPGLVEPPPSSSPTQFTVDANGVPLAHPTSLSSDNGGSRPGRNWALSNSPTGLGSSVWAAILLLAALLDAL